MNEHHASLQSQSEYRKREGGSRPSALFHRPWIAVIILVLTLLLPCTPFISTAWAAGDTTVRFGSGGEAVMHEDGSISGTCSVGEPQIRETWVGSSCYYRYLGSNITMPDGSVFYGTCYESYIGVPNHLDYEGPVAGEASFTATPAGDGTFFVLVHTEGLRGCFTARGIFSGIGTQRLYFQQWMPDLSLDVTFTKVSTDTTLTAGNVSYTLGGARYDIYDAETNHVVASITTDDAGHAAYRLAQGSYYAIETVAPRGFILNSDRIPFEVNSDTAATGVTLGDVPGSFTLKISKQDSSTGGAPQVGTSFSGASYKVVDANGRTHAGTTDEDGVLVIDRLPFGTITVTETTAPTGYRLDERVHTYTVGPESMGADGVVELVPKGDFTEDVIAFDLRIAKTAGAGGAWNEGSGHERAAEGVAFEIVSNTTDEVVGTIVTDEDGFATTEGLWFGAGERAASLSGALPYDAAGYTVREVPETVPDGLDIVEPWTITAEQMVDGAELRYLLNDAQLSSFLQIIKVDADTGRTVPLAHFSFQLIDEEGALVRMTDTYPSRIELQTFTTDDSGSVYLPEELEPGTYTIHEVGAAAPYLTADDLTLEISSDYEHITPLAAVRVADEQARGRARLHKVCAGGAGHLDGSCSLEGAEFDVIAVGDIVSPDGCVRAADGEIVDHVVTDEQGYAETQDLWLGSGSATYAFIETTAPEGHALDPTPHEFTVSYVDASTELVYADVEVANAPSEVVVEKSILGSDQALEGATFEIWRADDEVTLAPEDGHAALALRAADDAQVTLSAPGAVGKLSLDLPEGWTCGIDTQPVYGDHLHVRKVESPMALTPGTYTLTLSDEKGFSVDLGDSAQLEIASGEAVCATWTPGLLGAGGTLAIERTALESETCELTWSDVHGAFTACSLDEGTFDVLIDGERAGKIELTANTTTFAASTDEGIETRSHLLVPGADEHLLTTSDEGLIRVAHLTSGSYRLQERSAPAGYLVDDTIHYFTTTEDGLTEGFAVYTTAIENDYTKVDLSKRDITSESEVPGAQLAVLDADGAVVESWISEATPHRINALAPGTYTLVEQMTPRAYDEATAVTFTVRACGDVQPVAIYDEPIIISGEVDKRQEIADPTAPDTFADDATRGARVNTSATGSFDYAIDFHSTSTTWVDECTVTDELAGAAEGLATLRSITTPRAEGDFDGTFNVWYRTNIDDGVNHAAEANATRDDGHANPWLDHETVVQTVGEDGRVLDYSGWRLWATGIPTQEAHDLSADDLALAEGEVITAIRLEYGRVDVGFTTRRDEWDRDNLKDAHDDVDDVAPTHAGGHPDDEEPLAPLIVRMSTTEAYTGDTQLVNAVLIDLYRNGGSMTVEDELEAHDHDAVVQIPRTNVRELDKTGTDAMWPALITTGSVASAGAIVIGLWVRRHPS